MMNQWDDLLARMPSAPCPPLLAERVKGRVAQARRMAAWFARAVRIGLGLTAAAGVWMIAPRFDTFIKSLASLSSSSLVQWLENAVSSPLTALGALALELDTWQQGFETGLVMALALLAIPALFSLVSVLGVQSDLKGAPR